MQAGHAHQRVGVGEIAEHVRGLAAQHPQSREIADGDLGVGGAVVFREAPGFVHRAREAAQLRQVRAPLAPAALDAADGLQRHQRAPEHRLQPPRVQRPRLGAYLEQSTRYIAYDMRTEGRYRYYRDPEILGSDLGLRYIGDMDWAVAPLPAGPDRRAIGCRPCRALRRHQPVTQAADARAKLAGITFDLAVVDEMQQRAEAAFGRVDGVHRMRYIEIFLAGTAKTSSAPSAWRSTTCRCAWSRPSTTSTAPG